MAYLKFKDENNQWQDLPAIRGRDGVIQYQAGNGIVIEGDTISAIQQDLSDYYTKAQVNGLINAIETVQLEPVSELPATGEPNVIYLVPSSNPQTANAKDEYIYINDAWEQIGTTAVDLSNYYTKTQIDAMGVSQYGIPIYYFANASNYNASDTISDWVANFTQTEQENLANIIMDAYEKGYLGFSLLFRTTQYRNGAFPIFTTGGDVLQNKPNSFALFANALVDSRYDRSGARKFASAQMQVVGSWSGDVYSVTRISFYNTVYDMLTLDNTHTYTPTTDYHPATKKYVDDALGNIDLSSAMKVLYIDDYSTSGTALNMSELDTGVYYITRKTNVTTLYLKPRDGATARAINDLDGRYTTILVYPNKIPATYTEIKTFIIYQMNANMYGDYLFTDNNSSFSATWTDRSASVSLSGNQTVNGKKTFNKLPESSATPTTNNQLVNKKYVDDSIPGVATTSAAGLMSATDKTSLNDLVTAVGSVSSTDVTNWNNAATNSHSHNNKTTLDTITAQDITDWSSAVTNSHTHTNKTVLDGISSNDITNWNKVHIYSGTSAPGAGTGENGDIYVKYTA